MKPCLSYGVWLVCRSHTGQSFRSTNNRMNQPSDQSTNLLQSVAQWVRNLRGLVGQSPGCLYIIYSMLLTRKPIGRELCICRNVRWGQWLREKRFVLGLLWKNIVLKLNLQKNNSIEFIGTENKFGTLVDLCKRTFIWDNFGEMIWNSFEWGHIKYLVTMPSVVTIRIYSLDKDAPCYVQFTICLESLSSYAIRTF